MRLCVPAFFKFRDADAAVAALADKDWDRVAHAGADVAIVVAEWIPGPTDPNTKKFTGDPNYKKKLANCRARGQTILGYITSRFHPPNDRKGVLGREGREFALQSAQDWHDAYGNAYIDGIFVDEGPGSEFPNTDDEFKAYYQGIGPLAKDQGLLAALVQMAAANAAPGTLPASQLMLNATEYRGQGLIDLKQAADEGEWVLNGPNHANKVLIVEAPRERLDPNSNVFKPYPAWYRKYGDVISFTVVAGGDVAGEVPAIVGLVSSKDPRGNMAPTSASRGAAFGFVNDSWPASYRQLPPFWHRTLSAVQASPPTPLYHVFKGTDHYYTVSADERERYLDPRGLNYQPGGDVGLVYAQPPGPIPLYEYFKLMVGQNGGAQPGDNHYTTDLDERDGAVLNDDFSVLSDRSIIAYVLPRKVGDAELLYSYGNGKDHIYTTAKGVWDALRKGYVNLDARVGWVFPEADSSRDPMLVPLHQFYNPAVPAHFYRTDPGAYRGRGFQDQGPVCYVYPTAVSCTPLYRMSKRGVAEHHYATSLAERDPNVLGGANAPWVADGVACYLIPEIPPESIQQLPKPGGDRAILLADIPSGTSRLYRVQLNHEDVLTTSFTEVRRLAALGGRWKVLGRVLRYVP